MKRLFTLCAAALLLPAAGAMAQVDSMVNHPYVFPDFPGTTLGMLNSGNPNGGIATASITETNYVDDGPPNFANRHVIDLSDDGGATSTAFDIDKEWRFSTIVTLNAGGSPPPDKEAGLIIRSPVTGDAHFIVKTNGEIVAFGGPFYLAPDVYTPGTPIELMMTMTTGGDGIGGVPNFIEYSYDTGTAQGTSGPLVITNTEAGFINYSLGMFGQFPPESQGELNNADFNNVNFVPEPTSVALGGLGLIGLALVRRRFR